MKRDPIAIKEQIIVGLFTTLNHLGLITRHDDAWMHFWTYWDRYLERQ